MLVFIVRCLLNTGRMNRLHRFFMKDDVRRRIAAEYPFVYEQPTRAFFYNQSTFDERARLVEQHMEYLEKHIKEDVFLGLYSGKRYVLWESSGEIGHLRFELSYHPGQRKEGILSVVMRLDEDDLYQMMFWIAPDKAGEWALWIGAMQGPNMENARDVVKKVTRRCYSYRTKNFILHATQEVAKALGLHISMRSQIMAIMRITMSAGTASSRRVSATSGKNRADIPARTDASMNCP